MDYRKRKANRRESRRGVLLTEYQVCATRADFHTQLIWAWGTALVSLNAAGIGVLVQADKYTQGRFGLVVLLAIAGCFLLWWWNLASNRWHAIIRVIYERMKDIEKELGMGLNSYIAVHDTNEKFEAESANFWLRRRLRESTDPNKRGFTGLRELRELLNVFVPFAWSLVIVVESFSVLTEGKNCLAWVVPGCRLLTLEEYCRAVAQAIIGCLALLAARCILTRVASSK